MNDFERYEGKTTVEALELNRPEDWLYAKMEEVGKLMEDYSGLWGITSYNFLSSFSPGAENILGTPLAQIIINLCILFLKMGYLKGVQVTEDVHKLESLWKEL